MSVWVSLNAESCDVPRSTALKLSERQDDASSSAETIQSVNLLVNWQKNELNLVFLQLETETEAVS